MRPPIYISNVECLLECLLISWFWRKINRCIIPDNIILLQPFLENMWPSVSHSSTVNNQHLIYFSLSLSPSLSTRPFPLFFLGSLSSSVLLLSTRLQSTGALSDTQRISVSTPIDAKQTERHPPPDAQQTETSSHDEQQRKTSTDTRRDSYKVTTSRKSNGIFTALGGALCGLCCTVLIGAILNKRLLRGELSCFGIDKRSWTCFFFCGYGVCAMCAPDVSECIAGIGLT